MECDECPALDNICESPFFQDDACRVFKEKLETFAQKSNTEREDTKNG